MTRKSCAVGIFQQSQTCTQPRQAFSSFYFLSQRSALESTDCFEFEYYPLPPPDANQSQAAFLHPPLHPPLSTTDLCLCTNVSNSLAEVGVLYFRQKTPAFLLSSGWVWVLRAWPCTSEEMSGHSVNSVMRSKFFAPLRTDYIICETFCEIQNYIFQTSKP